MSEEPNIWALTMDALTSMEPMVSMARGLKEKFIAEGFTEEQAGDLAVEVFKVQTFILTQGKGDGEGEKG